jgi:hypothetical protein
MLINEKARFVRKYIDPALAKPLFPVWFHHLFRGGMTMAAAVVFSRILRDTISDS